MHEILFLIDDNLKTLLSNGIVSLPVYAAVDFVEYQPSIQPPYFVVMAKEAIESEAYQAENYSCNVEFCLVVDPLKYDQSIRDECAKLISFIKEASTPDLLSINGLTIQTIAASGARFRREISDRMFKVVGSVEMFGYLSS